MLKRAAYWFLFCTLVTITLQLDASASIIASVVAFIATERIYNREVDCSTRKLE